MALVEQAELGVDDPAPLLAEAREIFERLGATPWLERVDAARARGDRLARGYSPHMAVDHLESLLRDAFPDAPELRVEDRTGGGDHFQVTVASPRFDGLPLLEQHRLVNDALAEPLRDGTIHELRIKTRGTT